MGIKIETSLSTFADFVGQRNKLQIEPHRLALLAGNPLSPVAIIAPYGGGKTNLARLLIKAYCCPYRTSTGDPCHTCPTCLEQGPKHNGAGWFHRHFEFDCTRLNKADIRRRLRAVNCEDGTAVCWDEFASLGASTTKMFLKTAEDFAGLFIIAMTSDEYQTMLPQLYDRMHKLCLTTPSVEEITDFFVTKNQKKWNIATDRDTLQQMVERTGCGFRACQKTLQVAANMIPPVLDRNLLDTLLPITDRPQQCCTLSGLPDNIDYDE